MGKLVGKQPQGTGSLMVSSRKIVYLPTNLPWKSTIHVGEYTMTMDPSWVIGKLVG